MRHLTPFTVPSLLTLSICFLAALIFSSNHAKAWTCEDESKSGALLMTWYMSNEHEGLSDLLFCYSYLVADTNSLSPVAAFFATTLDESPDIAEAALSRTRKLEPKYQTLAIIAAWQMHQPQGRAFLESSDQNNPYVQEALETPTPDMQEYFPKSGELLDVYWSIFFATGEAWPIIKITTALDLEDDEAIEIRAVAGAAEWSLTNNGKSHPRLVEILQEEANRAPPHRAERIEAIINDINNKAAS